MRKQYDSGSMMKFLPILFSLVVAGILAMYFIGFQSEASIRQHCDQLARKYLLRMESDGYLTAAAKAELETAFYQCGVRSLSFEGTTLNPVGYGKPVVLQVMGLVGVDRYELPDLFDVRNQRRVEGIRIRKETTAKN